MKAVFDKLGLFRVTRLDIYRDCEVIRALYKEWSEDYDALETLKQEAYKTGDDAAIVALRAPEYEKIVGNRPELRKLYLRRFDALEIAYGEAIVEHGLATVDEIRDVYANDPNGEAGLAAVLAKMIMGRIEALGAAEQAALA